MSDHSPAAPPAPAARDSAWQMYAAVMGVGIACAVAIVAVYETTRPIIQRNRVERRNRAILDVLPGAQSSAAFVWTETGFHPATAEAPDDELVFAGYDSDHRLAGLAIEAEGVGYQDLVKVLYGYEFDRQSIIGFRVLQTRETPGLGDRIATDANFLSNFAGLDVRLQEGNLIAHPIEFVKPGEKTEPWQIDGISGATITSQAVAHMLRDSSQKWMPRAHPRRTEFNRSRRKKERTAEEGTNR